MKCKIKMNLRPVAKHKIEAKFLLLLFLPVILIISSCATPDNSEETPNQASSEASGEIDTIFQLTIDKMPMEEESNGTYCQSILGRGWSCTVEIRVVNNSDTAWNGSMNANLVTPSGVVSEGSDSTEVDYLTSTFDSKVNPGQKYRWITYFEVGPDLRFSSVQILSQDKMVSNIPVCIGSNYNDALGC